MADECIGMVHASGDLHVRLLRQIADVEGAGISIAHFFHGDDQQGSVSNGTVAERAPDVLREAIVLSRLPL